MLSEAELAHAKSILEPPTLEPLPHLKPLKILIASVIRKPPVVVSALLETLEWQALRQPAAIDYAFVTNFAAGDTYAPKSLLALNEFQPEGNVGVAAAPNPGNDYGEGPVTRQWTPSAWHRIGAIKDDLLTQAVARDYDYVWLVDADVFCDQYTLQSLIDSGAPIVSAVYWTFWQKPNADVQQYQHAGPQVWVRHPYIMNGGQWTDASFRKALVDRQRITLGGLGACTLIQKDALIKGVGFSKVGELPPGPMSDGEDRHFCKRAAMLHLPLVADAWPDVWHCYHPTDYEEIPKRLTQLAVAHRDCPDFGDLVSVKITPLEPVPSPRGLTMPAAQWVRGRFGALNIMPEIEEQLASLKVGEQALVDVHFPVHYELRQLAGQKRIYQVDLLDCKAFSLAPTIEEELLIGTKSGRVIDPTERKPEHVEELVGVVDGG